MQIERDIRLLHVIFSFFEYSINNVGDFNFVSKIFCTRLKDDFLKQANFLLDYIKKKSQYFILISTRVKILPTHMYFKDDEDKRNIIVNLLHGDKSLSPPPRVNVFRCMCVNVA